MLARYCALGLCGTLSLFGATGAAAPSPAVPTSQEVPPPVELTPPPESPGPSSTTPTEPSDAEPAPTEPAPAPLEPRPVEPAPAAPTTSTPSESQAVAAPVEPAAEPAKAAPKPGVYQHDGFFVRLSSGFSAWAEALGTIDDSEVYDGSVDGRSTGIATASDLSIGGNISRSFVLAFTLQGTNLLASTFRLTESSDASVPAELDPGLRTLALLGGTVLYYPDDRGGFFLEGGLGLALLAPGTSAPSNRDDDQVYAAGGLGLALSVGQQWFFSEQLSIGVRARTTVAALVGKDQHDVEWLHAVAATPAVLVDVAYH